MVVTLVSVKRDLASGANDVNSETSALKSRARTMANALTTPNPRLVTRASAGVTMTVEIAKL